nr:class I adenylate-forming enzyme family protein [Rhodococcus sp. 14C212]
MLLDLAAEHYGDRIALGHPETGISYRELERRSRVGAAELMRVGARSLVYVGVNGPAVPVLLFSAARAGIPFVPLNYRLASTAIDDLIAGLDDPLIVADESISQNLTLPQDARGCITSNDWITRSSVTDAEAVENPDARESPVAIILFTSGTTAKPKGVLLRHENLASYILSTVDLNGAVSGECVLASVPPYHVAGMSGALSNIYSGRRISYLPDFDADAWLDVVVEENVTHAMLVPTMLSRVVAAYRTAPRDLPSLKSIAYGGAKIPERVLHQALELFPRIEFTNAYGLTETSSTIALLSPEDHRIAVASNDTEVRSRLRSVGRLVPGVEAQIRDTDGRVITEAGAVGELWIRGPQVSGEYQRTGAALDAEGWFPTRDRARFDHGGYLFIEGRADDTIIRGGENIYPAEIERVLQMHSAVADACVFGLPDEDWGERTVAAVVPAQGIVPDAEEIRSFVRSRLRGSRTPDLVVIREDLPYGPTGKIVRRDLVSETLADLEKKEVMQ